MDWTIASALAVGFTLGLRHALDADHLAAVAVMVSDGRKPLARSSLVGLAWGAGHAAALSAVGLVVILFGLRVPERFAAWMEFTVGAMLVYLGGRHILRYREGALLHAHPHEHGDHAHFHPHVHPAGADPAHTSHHRLPAAAARLASEGIGRRPFIVGMVHGMAGSAALMLLVLTSISGVPARLSYVALFAAGSIAGMALMSALVGLPFAGENAVSGRGQRGLRIAAGAVSVGLGLSLMLSFGPALRA